MPDLPKVEAGFVRVYRDKTASGRDHRLITEEKFLKGGYRLYDETPSASDDDAVTDTPPTAPTDPSRKEMKAMLKEKGVSFANNIPGARLVALYHEHR